MQINELDTIAVEEEFGSNIIETIAKSTDEQSLRDLKSLIETRLVELSRNEPDAPESPILDRYCAFCDCRHIAVDDSECPDCGKPLYSC